MQNSILEQIKVAEQDYMLQLLKQLKLYTKFVPETVRYAFTSKLICDYLCTTIIYKSIFTTET